MSYYDYISFLSNQPILLADWQLLQVRPDPLMVFYGESWCLRAGCLSCRPTNSVKALKGISSPCSFAEKTSKNVNEGATWRTHL